ncbi:MAG: hypothetical protein ABI792_00990 [bacterium]
MNSDNVKILNTHSLIENLSRTLLYEGYSLFPYHRAAIKNQKPFPIGVIFPEDYNAGNPHANSLMQAQCVFKGDDKPSINISVRFLHLNKIEISESKDQLETDGDRFIPVHNLEVNDKTFVSGWLATEQQINTEELYVSELLNGMREFSFKFNEKIEHEEIKDQEGLVAGRRSSRTHSINGIIFIEVSKVYGDQNFFIVTIRVFNKTKLENPDSISRDEALLQSFLSTHMVLSTNNGQFISTQNPAEEWKNIISETENINTWPVLIDENNTTMLSSPIIIYDYPKINPLSRGDLFDSTEIEEALLLHVSVLSDEEKKRIAQSDDKLEAMLKKVSQVTPREMINLHGGLKEITNKEI